MIACLLAAIFLCAPASAEHPCTSPLVLDLDGDGRILTSGLENAVEFDINGDGLLDSIGWTALDSEDGFLWLDLNLNGEVDDGSELFGSSTLLPTGEFASNGFEALAVYDRETFGGNADGLISRADLVWNRLRIWVDRSHDGISQRPEIRPLDALGVASIGLDYREIERFDGHVNFHALSGEMIRRIRLLGGAHLSAQLVEDIFFVVRSGGPEG